MLVAALRTFGVCVGLFVATYAPTFAVVHLLKQPLDNAVPTIIALSLLIALVLIVGLIIIAGYRWDEFGFRWATRGYVAWSLGAGIPLAIGLTWLDHLFGGAGPLRGLSLPLGISLVYFGLCAPLQEEVIFRGLIQTAVARSAPRALRIGAFRLSSSALVVAVLFGLIHLEVTAFTALAAFLLGIFAGELRMRSRSLIPAVMLHVFFNLGSFLWMIVR